MTRDAGMNENTNRVAPEEDHMSGISSQSGVGRRGFLKRGALLSVAVGGTGALGTKLALADNHAIPGAPGAKLLPSIRLMATDGHISLPGRRFSDVEWSNRGVNPVPASWSPADWAALTDPEVWPGSPMYMFGFRAVDDPMENDDKVFDLVNKYKGRVSYTSPTIEWDEGLPIVLTLTNLGFTVRPDLDDSHSLHWHGFRNATSLFDGVPEVSISVPANRDFPYYFEPKASESLTQPWLRSAAGTYMYHCHFEDTEHVQMGMTGIVYIRPVLEVENAAAVLSDAWLLNPVPANTHFAYNDRDKGTGELFHANVDSSYQRHWALLLNEIDIKPHDGSEAVEEFVWTDYKSDYWTMNGRCYPDTTFPELHPAGNPHELAFQPNSSLIQIEEGERGLLRLANLGFEVHSMELTGIRVQCVGADASLLMDDAGGDNTFWTNHIDLGPGEARDAIFVAPDFDEDNTLIDPLFPGQPYNRYLLRNRNMHRNSNNGDNSLAGDFGLGGMVTEVRVFAAGSLPAQQYANETYPAYANV
jgi:FtsP/CotA-like multicopper oxidase with cupredoxin domain